jgi:hypothetical protein
VVRRLGEQFGERLRYVYRHLPLGDRSEATRAAELAEYVAETSGDYLTAPLEKSFSVDNLVVFALVFSQTGVPPALQRRVLFPLLPRPDATTPRGELRR